MEIGNNAGQVTPKNFGGVVHELKANHNKETDGPFGQAVSALAKSKHGPLPLPPVESTNPVSGIDTVDIQSTPLQATTAAVLNSVNETFDSNLTLSSSTAEKSESVDSVSEDALVGEAEVLAPDETSIPVEGGGSEDESVALSVEETAQQIVSLTSALFDPATDDIDSFYGTLAVAIESGFQDGLASFSNEEDVNQILSAYEQVQQGIDAFYLEQSGSESARVWGDLTPVLVEPEEGSEGTTVDVEGTEVQQQSEPLPEYAQIQSLLDDGSTTGLSVEA
ncbi:MAG: hypothetical protein K6L74_09845 [Neptuniibacter sp.]